MNPDVNCEDDKEQRIASIRARCKEKGIAILPYGSAWWLKGENFSLVLFDLASIDVSRLDSPTRYYPGKGVKVCFK